MLSDASMLAIIGDGLLNDLLLSVCAEIGMPLNKPYHVGYVTPTVSYLSLQGIRYLLFFSYSNTLNLNTA